MKINECLMSVNEWIWNLIVNVNDNVNVLFKDNISDYEKFLKDNVI